ncbi:hypothetical protein GQX74_008863 [Glossina fuscipes]|nr:hypothetical protein GQX74_008863 [Glossina fuscipes]
MFGSIRRRGFLASINLGFSFVTKVVGSVVLSVAILVAVVVDSTLSVTLGLIRNRSSSLRFSSNFSNCKFPGFKNFDFAFLQNFCLTYLIMVDHILGIDWGAYKNLRITDIHEKMRPQVRSYMMEGCRNHRLFELLKVGEDPGVEEDMLRIINHILENDCSIMVTDDQNAIRAVALVKCMTAEARSWTALRLIVRSTYVSDFLELLNTTLQSGINLHPDDSNKDSLHFFSYRVDENLLPDKCFMRRFHNAICEVARHMKMPRITYVALLQADRDFVTENDFIQIVTTIYSMFMLRNRRPFDRMRDTNEMFAALYIKDVPPLIHFDSFQVRHPHLATKEAPKKKIAEKMQSIQKPGPSEADEDKN